MFRKQVFSGDRDAPNGFELKDDRTRHAPTRLAIICVGLAGSALAFSAQAAKLAEVQTVDDEIVMVHWLDSEVEWKDTGTGPSAFHGLEESAGEVIHLFPPALDTAAAVAVDNYTIASATDAHYAAPTKPLASQLQQRLRLVPDHPGSADRLHCACSLHRCR